MDMTANIHIGQDDAIAGSVSRLNGRAYGVVYLGKNKGYGGATVFLGDNAEQTRESVRKLRRELAAVIRNLPKG